MFKRKEQELPDQYPGLPPEFHRAAELYRGRVIDGEFRVDYPGLPGSAASAEDEEKRFAKALRDATRKDFVERGDTWYSRMLRRVVRFAWRLARKLIRKLWARRRILAPELIGTAAYCAGAIMWLLKSSYPMIGVVPPLFGVGMAPLLYWWLGGRLGRLTRDVRNLKPLTHRRWYAAAYATLILLTTITAAWKPAPPVPALWLAAAGVFGSRWWWHHRARDEDKPAIDPRVERLMRAKILRGQGVIPGELVEITGPDRLVIDVALTYSDLLVSQIAATEPRRQMAKALGIPRENIIVDDLVTGSDIAARITGLRENLINNRVIWDESWRPDASDPVGTFRYHRYGDGQLARLRLWTPKSGTKNTLFSGDIGTGKSAGMLAAAIQAMWTGHVYPIVGDPQGGQSLTTLAGDEGIVEMKATDPEQVYYQLEAIHAAMLDRSRYLKGYVWYDEHRDRQVGMPFFCPTTMQAQEYNPLYWPVILYLLDEAHMACKDERLGTMITDLLEMVIKLSRKTGIAVWAATQYPGIEELGGRMPIRQNLINGNIVAFRNSTQIAGTMMLPSYFPSPFDIPKETPEGEETQGFAIISSAAPKSSRAAYSRVGYIERATKVTNEAAPKIMALDEVTGNAFADNNVALGDQQLAVEVATMAAEQAAGTVPEHVERERIVVAEKPAEPKRPGREPKVLKLAVEYLQKRVREGEFAPATSGTIAEAIGMSDKLSSVNMALNRGIKAKVVHKYQNQDRLWALGPAPAVEAEAGDPVAV